MKPLNTIFKYTVLFSLTLLIACNTSETTLLTGSYQCIEDTCKTIHFLNEQEVKYTRRCSEEKNDGVELRMVNGEYLELHCGQTQYKIDRIDSNQGIYLHAFDKNNNKCRGLHIIQGDDYLVLTELKQGEDIDFDFTEPKVYQQKQSKKIKKDPQKLIVEVPQGMPERETYIAFEQKTGPQTRVDQDGNLLLKLDTSKAQKTQMVINPKFYAFKSYEFREVNEAGQATKILPIIYHAEYHKMRGLSEEGQSAFFAQRGIEQGDRYVILYRFNPARKRVVYKVYGEEIVGQVQDFRLERRS